jgi:predicted nucleic acid-binding protein
MTVYTIDASVHINALNEKEAESEASQKFLALLERERFEMICPTLLVTEIAAALSRAFDDYEKGMAFANAVRDLPKLTLISLDETLAIAAAELAARHRLRGADAVYAAVANQYKTTLVTNDRQQLERLSGILPVVQPAQALVQKSE